MGAKNRFLDDRMQLNFSAFRYDYTDYQVAQTQPLPYQSNPAVSGKVIWNAGGATVNGAEIETEVLLNENDQLSFQVAYLDATFDELTLPFYRGSAPVFEEGTPSAYNPSFGTTLSPPRVVGIRLVTNY